MKKRSADFHDLIQVMKHLRSSHGCPWDRKQTHKSLLKYLKEESQELAGAVAKKDWYNLEEELGDVLLQVIFHAQMASEKSAFDIYDVVGHLKRKLTMRHPHVFEKKRKNKWTSQDVVNNWGDLKTREKEFKMKEHQRMKKRMAKTPLV